MSDPEIAQLRREIEELTRAREAAEAREKQERREREAAEAREKQERREKEQERREREAAEAREKQERREKEQERREKEQLRHENQPTTLDKYLRNCHTLLYKIFKLADKSIFSTGFIKVDGKFYPK
ncbi:hypothetical protein PG996_002972 [Apiospora saccharicola]|uniref:Chromatin assembly factor 1 p150 subunit acidic region domain-containing protein n=1 Tax=Apiospora saccharicola TaxID=335842 RepID=A0ABR1VZX3_9PEZI